MNIEAYKNQIIKKLVDIQDQKILEQVDAVLNENPIVAHSIDGNLFTEFQYKEYIKSISQSVADGAETYTSEQVRSYVLSQKK